MRFRPMSSQASGTSGVEFSDEYREYGIGKAEEVVEELKGKGMEIIELTDSEADRWKQTWFETSRDRVLEADPVKSPPLLEMAACVADRT